MDKDEYTPEQEEDFFTPEPPQEDENDFSEEYDFASGSEEAAPDVFTTDEEAVFAPVQAYGDGENEYEGNPADNDGLDRAEDFPETEEPGIEDTETVQTEEEEEEEEAAVKRKLEPDKNKAPFLDKFKILMIVFIALILLILVSVFLFSGEKDTSAENVLDKKGAVYIPDTINRWNPDKFVTENSPFPGNTAEEDLTEKEVEELLAEISYSDEAQEQVAPVDMPSNTGGYVASSSIPARPVTNRNEQQKDIPRMPLTDYPSTSYGQNSYQPYGQQYSGQTGYMNSGDYASYAQNRMDDLLGQVQGYNNANTYQSQNMQDNKQNFFNQNSGQTQMQWNTDHSLFYGTIIPAVLITGINTDLPGVVIAQVTSNVYSSQTGEHLLIPSGTKIYATYNSSVSYGQDRVQVAWNKMIRPDGLEIDLGNFTGVDSRGYAGYGGWVNNHPFETLKALGLIAAFSIFDTKVGNLQDAQNNMYAQNAIADTYAEINRLSGKIIDRALDIQPTITVPQGKEVKIITNVTMNLPPFGQKQVYEKYVRR